MRSDADAVPWRTVLTWICQLTRPRSSVLHLASLSLCTVLLCFSAWGSSLTLTWDPNADPDVAGYMLYYGSSSATYTNAINSGTARTNTVSGLIDGVTYFFAVTA